MKIFLFSRSNMHLLVKGSNEFMATCYANQWLEGKYTFRFETHDAVEVDNDMSFGVVISILEGDVGCYNSENKYYKKQTQS